MTYTLLPTVIFGVLGSVTLCLAGYALFLFLRLRKQSLMRKQEAEDLLVLTAEREAHARRSIKLLCDALLKNDISDTEAAMRVAYLSQQISLSDDEKQHLEAFHQLSKATAHIPILGDWQGLSRSEQRSFKQERVKIEAEFHAFIHASAAHLSD